MALATAAALAVAADDPVATFTEWAVDADQRAYAGL